MSSSIFYIFFIVLVYQTNACGPPPKIDGTYSVGTVSKEIFAVNSEVEYKCKNGYFYREGRNTAKCISKNGIESWEPPTLRCSINSCSTPDPIANGKVVGTLFTFGSVITYRCDPGYELKGLQKERFCLPRGRWGGQIPKCEPIICPTPETPRHGRAEYIDLTFKSKVEFSCPPPFVLRGHKERICTENKTWSGTHPKCEEVKCEKPESLLGGRTQFNGLNVGELLLYICDVSDVEVSAICQEDGRWSSLPPRCIDILTTIPSITTGSTNINPISTRNPEETGVEVCKPPPVVENAYHDHSNSKEQFSTNTKLIYKCNKGCRLKSRNEEDKMAICTKINGQMIWVGPTIKCADCNLLYIIIGVVAVGILLGIISVILVCWCRSLRSSKTKKIKEKAINSDEVMNMNLQERA